MNDTLPGFPPELEGVKINTTIYIDLLGHLWYGQPATMQYTISDRQIKRGGDGIVVAGDLWVEDGTTELDAIDRWLTTNTGDFRDIVATRVVKVEKAVTYPEHEDETWTVSVHYTRETHLRDFTEDEENEFNDCMFPSEELFDDDE